MTTSDGRRGGNAGLAGEGEGPLAGVRVIELTHAIAGPQTGQILADQGADVIKVEPPYGDRARLSFPVFGGDSVYFACHNRGKRSVVIDLKQPEGLDAFLSLVAEADVLLTNYSRQVPDRRGWGWDVVSELNPRLVMAHITGFGTVGPDRDRLAYDGIIQVMSGIPDYTGPASSGPVCVGAFIADHIVAYHAAFGIVLALHRRPTTGFGTFLDMSMLNSYIASAAHGIEAGLAGQPLPQQGNRVPTAFSNTYPAADGAVYLAPLGDLKWAAFCALIGRPEWQQTLTYRDAVTDRRDEAEAAVRAWCATRTRTEIVAEMAAVGIPCGPALTVAEAATNLIDAGSPAITTVQGPMGMEFSVPGPIVSLGNSRHPQSNRVPSLGEHTDEVMAEVGRQRSR